MLNKEILELLGTKFDYDDVISAFDTEEMIVINKIAGQTSNFEGHGECTMYNVYENKEKSDVYVIFVNQERVIVEIKIL